jgi:serine phosphatase RsbU (regulator of sigma subunit)
LCGAPAEIARAFNRLMLEEIQVEQYFTMAYAELDLATGGRGWCRPGIRIR